MYKILSRGSVSPLFRSEEAVPKVGKWYEKLSSSLLGVWSRCQYQWLYKIRLKRCIQAIHTADVNVQSLSKLELKNRVSQLSVKLKRYGFYDQHLAEAFSLIREVAFRTIGMRHFDSQISGGWYMLHGRVVEMATGEGKTLTAILPAAAAGLAGVPTHVITVNDYLAERDYTEMGPVYRALGLSVGCIREGMSIEDRIYTYSMDVVYCSNNQLVFDYLKDYLLIKKAPSRIQRLSERLKGKADGYQRLMLRGLHFAIVDEADSVCMDEARTPLIISAGGASNNGDEQLQFEQALAMVEELKESKDYLLFENEKRVSLLEAGRLKVDKIAQDLSACWVGQVRRYELVGKALTAAHAYKLDRDYLVRDGEIQIIDPSTGRVMAGRRWEGGLHQLLELKEACQLTEVRDTLAKISYQRFFRRYRHLSGMTGTAQEVRLEFWDVYRKLVVSLQTHHTLQRKQYSSRVFADDQQQADEVVASAQRQLAKGRAVLIGTASVKQSESIAEAFFEAKIDVLVLNAKQDADEAEILKRAGQPGAITIATSMAGRGTDIKLHSAVKDAGGLHVILCQLHDAARIDRQLQGRSARFGDPGSFEFIVSLNNDWFRSTWYLPILRKIASSSFGESVCMNLLQRYQARLESKHRKTRYQVLDGDDHHAQKMAFTESGL